MAIPDAVQALLPTYGGVPAATHPYRSDLYDLAAATIASTRWGSNYTNILAMATAHLCLANPANTDDAQRGLVTDEPVGSMGNGNRKYKYDFNSREYWNSTAPGRLYWSLRTSLLGSGTPVVI